MAKHQLWMNSNRRRFSVVAAAVTVTTGAIVLGSVMAGTASAATYMVSDGTAIDASPINAAVNAQRNAEAQCTESGGRIDGFFTDTVVVYSHQEDFVDYYKGTAEYYCALAEEEDFATSEVPGDDELPVVEGQPE